VAAGNTAAGAAPGLRLSSATGRWVLAAAVLGSGIAAIDATVVGIALPAIARDFHASVASMQWVVDGYTLPLAGLLLLGGALGDVHGRRRTFIIGTIWFALASLACGLAPDTGFLIAARAMQGVGAALLTPGSLAILQASFAPDDRARAIGAWSGLGGVATAAGPFLGGWLIGAVSWRLVFFINLPVAAAVVVIASRHVPESHAPGPRQPLDVAGAVSISLALAGLTYGLIAASAEGWTSPVVLGSLIAGAALFAAFVVTEARSAHPMLPLGLFRVRQFSASNAVTFVDYGALGGALFLVPVVLQEVGGYSPLAAGTALLPLTAVMLALSARSAALSARIGPRLQMTAGPLVIAVGLVLFTRVEGDANYLTQVLPAVLVLGFGLAINVAPLTATALSAAPAEHAGIASAVNNDVARTASLIAVAVLPVLAGLTGDAYLQPSVLTRGFHVAMLIAAAGAAAGGILAALTIRNPPRPGRAAAGVPAGAPAGATARTAAGAATGRTEPLPSRYCALDGPPLCSDVPGPLRPGAVAAGDNLGRDDSSPRRDDQ
jgi:EmrB/QacA subfamily drug resistance transporter